MTSRALTGLRGVAALVIVLHHVMLRLPDVAAGPARQGYLAVDLFFVLSGFVMALGYGTWFGAGQSLHEYGLFMGRRIARVWPLHAVVVALLVADALVRHTGEYWPRMVIFNLLLMQSWGFSQTVDAPAWSVSTEMLAYILFPLLSGLALRRTARVAWRTLAVAVAVLVFCVLAAPDLGLAQRGALDLHQNWSLLPALRCLAGFTIGLLTWRALQTRRGARVAAQPAVATGAGLAIVGLVLLGAPDGLIYLCFPVLIAGLYAGAGPLTRWLAKPAAVWMGTLSYAIYLVHFPLLDRANAWAPAGVAPFLALFVALLCPVVLVAHYGVERPAQAWLRRMGRRLVGLGRALPAAWRLVI